jgi:hypothetical protein
LLDPFLARLFERQDSIGAVPWGAFLPGGGIVKSAGFTRCLQRSDIATRVAHDLTVAERHDVRATPIAASNGWRFSGLPGERAMRSAIERLDAGILPVGVSTRPQARQATIRRRYGKTDRRINAMVVGPVALATTSASDPEFDLSNVSDVVLLADGRIAAYAEIGAKLLIFGRDGRGERRIGRGGRGPREIQNAANVSLLKGDTLVLLDRGNGKLVFATAAAGVVRETSLGSNAGLSTDIVGGAMPDGSLVLYQSLRRPPASPDARVRARLRAVLFRLDAPPENLLEFASGAYQRVETRYRGRVRSELVPVRLFGAAHLALLDTVLVVAPGPAFHLSLRDSRGASIGFVEDTTPRRVVNRAMRNSQVEDELGRLRRAGTEPLLDPRESQRLIREAPFADSVGAIHKMHVSIDDRVLWVVDAIVPGDREWTAIGFFRDGTIYGNVRGAVTKGIPVAFRGNRVALQFEDDEGVARIGVFPLMRGPE